MDPYTATANLATQILVNVDHWFMSLTPEQKVQYNDRVLGLIADAIAMGKKVSDLLQPK